MPSLRTLCFGWQAVLKMIRRGARAAEWGGLENRCTFIGTVGSNPTLSATLRSSNFGRHARSEVELGVSHEALA